MFKRIWEKIRPLKHDEVRITNKGMNAVFQIELIDKNIELFKKEIIKEIAHKSSKSQIIKTIKEYKLKEYELNV